MNKLKRLARRLPLVDAVAKRLYDWQREKSSLAGIRKLMRSHELAYARTAPPSYAVGHEPTIRCNLKCKMCYQGQTRATRRKELSTAEILSLYEKLKDRTRKIKLVGGEPLVRADLFELISFWDRNNTKISLQTNCTLINEESIRSLKKFKNITDILTSLDGPREVHDHIRGVPGAFDRLARAIRLIQAHLPAVSLTGFAVMLVEDNLDRLPELADGGRRQVS